MHSVSDVVVQYYKMPKQTLQLKWKHTNLCFWPDKILGQDGNTFNKKAVAISKKDMVLFMFLYIHTIFQWHAQYSIPKWNDQTKNVTQKENRVNCVFSFWVTLFVVIISFRNRILCTPIFKQAWWDWWNTVKFPTRRQIDILIWFWP